MDKTIFVILDACQYEAGTRNLGYLEHMIDYCQGAKYKVRGELPSLSRPVYATLLTGLPVYRHGITRNAQVQTLSCAHVFSLCQAGGGVTAAAAYHWMSELYNHAPFAVPADRIQFGTGGTIDYGIYYWEDPYPDTHVFADGEYLRKTYNPDFLLIHTMAVDHMGHVHGAGSVQYENAIAMASDTLAMVLPLWLAQGCSVVVTADHGMNALGMHGGTDNAQRDTPLYVFSDKIKKGRFDDHDISQLNVAPLLCRLLGIAPDKAMRQELEIEGF